MARVEIAVTKVPSQLTNAVGTATTGDPTLDMQVDGDGVPNLHLVVNNAHTSPVTFDILYQPLISVSGVVGNTVKSQSVAAASGGIEGVRCIVLDAPAFIQADGKIYIDSGDANLTLCRFYAFILRRS